MRRLLILLLRAARFDIGRCYAALGQLHDGDLNDLALQSVETFLVSELAGKDADAVMPGMRVPAGLPGLLQ